MQKQKKIYSQSKNLSSERYLSYLLAILAIKKYIFIKILVIV